MHSPNASELATALAGHVADRLTQAITQRGTALLAVSGGTTPARFFAALSQDAIAWDKVTVTLVDERFVPASSPRSNAGLVAANLLQNAAKSARFVPLYHAAASIEAAAASDDAALQSLPWPLDVVILGMGGDGHTASFFPDADRSAVAARSRRSRRIVLPVHARERRRTAADPVAGAGSSMPASSRCISKARTSSAASKPRSEPRDEMPIRAVFDASPKPVEIFWAP